MFRNAVHQIMQGLIEDFEVGEGERYVWYLTSYSCTGVIVNMWLVSKCLWHS